MVVVLQSCVQVDRYPVPRGLGLMAEQPIMVYGIVGHLASFWMTPPVCMRSLQRAIKKELGIRVRDQMALQGMVELVPSDVLPLACEAIMLVRVKRLCQICGWRKRLRTCSACFSAYYCSTTCQQMDWPRHRRGDNCKARGEALRAT